MKAIVTCGTSIIRGNITRIIIEGEKELKFIFDSSLEILFKKEEYNEPVFMNLLNILANVNVNSNGIHYIDIPNGTVKQIATTRSENEYNSYSKSSSSSDEEKTFTKPLIDGIFTQEPQGAVDKMNRDVLNKYKDEMKAQKLNQQQQPVR